MLYTFLLSAFIIDYQQQYGPNAM